MTSINTNVSALIASRILGQNNRNLNTTLERLSTGYRINSGEDDPAGLIASENLRSNQAGVRSAIGNAERAHSVVATAEGGLAEISDMLIRMQELVSQASSSGGLTTEEIAANQTQVDGMLASINRIASETSFEGVRLLNGSLGFTTSYTDTKLTDVEVRAAKGIETADSSVVVTLAAGDEATKADAGDTAAVTATGTWRVTGSQGAEVFTFATGATQAQIKTAINAASSITGVIVSGVGDVVSKKFGADQFVLVELLSGTGTGGLAASVTAGKVLGTDASITVGGVSGAVDGYQASVKTSTLDITFKMTDAFVGAAAGDTDTITIKKGGGATFQLSPNIGLAGQETLGISSVATYDLGTKEYGYLSDIATGQSENLADDPGTAQSIVAAAIKQVSTLRGRLGSFLGDTLESTMNSLQIAYENLSASESLIRDADFATETAALTRNQILVNASTSILALASSAPMAALSLLQ